MENLSSASISLHEKSYKGRVYHQCQNIAAIKSGTCQGKGKSGQEKVSEC